MCEASSYSRHIPVYIPYTYQPYKHFPGFQMLPVACPQLRRGFAKLSAHNTTLRVRAQAQCSRNSA